MRTVTYIRTLHPYGFRSGQWGHLKGTGDIKGRLCFKVQFLDGVSDYWVVADPNGQYEFKARELGS